MSNACHQVESTAAWRVTLALLQAHIGALGPLASSLARSALHEYSLNGTCTQVCDLLNALSVSLEVVGKYTIEKKYGPVEAPVLAGPPHQAAVLNRQNVEHIPAITGKPKAGTVCWRLHFCTASGQQQSQQQYQHRQKQHPQHLFNPSMLFTCWNKYLWGHQTSQHTYHPLTPG